MILLNENRWRIFIKKTIILFVIQDYKVKIVEDSKRCGYHRIMYNID